jgi:ferric enterobactin receptor
MRLLTVLTLILLSAVIPHRAGAQDQEVRISGTFGPAPLSEILREIRKAHGVRFAFDPALVDGEPVAASFDNTPVGEALSVLLAESGLTWKLVRRTIVIFEEQTAARPAMRETGTFTGVWNALVVDAETGEPLPFAVARIRHTGLGAVADPDGRIRIADIPSDTCEMVLRYAGYEERSFRMNTPAASRRAVGLTTRGTLLPAAVIRGEPPVLLESGGKPGMQSFNPADLAAISTNGETDIFRGAQLLPGISGTTENSNGLIIRGSDPDQSLVQFDDFTVFHLDHFFGMFSAINAEAVKQVRVHKSPPDAAFGGRTGGLVRITGKEGSPVKPSAGVSVGSLSGSVFAESPVGSGGSFILTARRSYMDAFTTGPFRKLYTTAYRQGPGNSSAPDVFGDGGGPSFFFQDMTAKMTWRTPAGDKFNVSGYAGRDHLEHAFRTEQRPDGLSARYTDESQWGNAGAGFRWQRAREGVVKSLISAGWSRYISNYFSADTLFNNLNGLFTQTFRDEEFELRDFSFRAERSFGLYAVRIRTGVHLNNSSFQADMTAAPGNEMGQREWVHAAYGSAEYAAKGWTLTPGIRMAYYGGTDRLYPEWRFPLTREIAGGFALKFSASRVHQFIHRLRPQSLNLNHSDFWIWSGDASVPVLRSDQYAGGIQWKRGQWQVDAEAYYKRNTGVFEYIQPALLRPEPGDSLAEGSGVAMGTDILLGWNGDGHHAWLSWSLGSVMNRFDDDLGSDIPEWYDQRHEIKAYYQREWKQWEFAVTWLFATGRPFTPALGVFDVPLEQGDNASAVVMGDLHSGRLPAYHRLDLAAGRKFSWRGGVYNLRASVFNVYDHRNLRDIRYLGSQNPAGGFSLIEEQIRMLGFMPAIQFQARW